MTATATPTPMSDDSMRRLDAIVPVSERPETKQAFERLRELLRQRKAIKDLTVVAATDDDVIKRVEAALAALQSKPELLRLDAEIEKAGRAAEAADEADRARLRAEFVALKRAAVKALVPAMREAARTMRALGAIEAREHELLGFVDRFAWPSL